jgi:hypothetical protein
VPPNYTGAVPFPRPKRKLIKIIVGVIVGILLVSTVGATVALYTRAWDPLWNPFRPEPDKVIQEMTQRMKSIKTIHSETKINAEIKNEDGSADISMSFNSDSDTTDPKNQKSAGDFNLAFSTESTSSYGSNEIKFSLGGEARTVANIAYFKLNTLPTMIVDSLRQETGIDLNELIANKWIKIDPESISESFEELLKIYFNVNVGEEMPAEVMDEIDKMFEKQINMQKEIQDKLKKIMEGKKFFIVKSELSDAEINGIKSYHYIMTLDQKELKSLIPEFAIIYIDMVKEMMPVEYPLSEEDIYDAKKQVTESLNKAFDEFFAKVGNIDGEVWIGKKDYLLYKVKVEKEIDLSKLEEQKREGVLQPPPSVQPTSRETFTIGLEIDFSNFDKPVTIEAPKESIDMMEIIEPILDQIIKVQAYQGTIEKMDIISNTAEYFFYTSQDYRNVKCENTQYFKYTCDEIEKYTGGKPVIYQSKNAYCAYIKLPQKTGTVSSLITYYCIDSRGVRGERSIFPGGKNFCNGITFICPSPPR